MPTEERLTDHLYIKVDGNDLSTEAMDDLWEVTVDTSLHLPDMFTIELHDEQLQWVDQGPFELGKEVEIAFIPEEGGSSQTLIKGEITALEPDFGEGTSATLLVRGYDRSHRLHRGTHSQAYLQVTDSDLANRIAQEAGLRTQVDSTSEVYDHVFQHNQTHMEFLTERAQRIGFEVFVKENTLYFRRPARNGNALELEWGNQLRSFRPRLTLVEQVDEVVVKGWKPKTRQTIVGQATRGEAEPETGHSQSGAQMASSAFSSARRLVVDRCVHSQAEADTLAQAILDELSGAFIEAEGVCYGEPRLRAGTYVRLTALGSQFSGTYFVTAATHVYRADAGYMTTFAIHGRRPETLPDLLQRGANGKNGLSGPVVGLVTNNNDPEGRGRVKVKFPWLSDEVESDWARVVGMGAGEERGFFCLPEVNDEVLVAFEQGDVARPYVIGGLWNGQDKPPLPVGQALENGNVHRRQFKTREGHTLTFIDGTDKGIVLETAGGHRLTLADEKKQIVVETAGGHKLVLDDGKSEVTLESTANARIKSAANLTIEAGSKLELKGATFSLNASAMGEVKAGATLNVQGALVKIN
jgi:phage protein D/phage baseplate assembly protein gpV